MRLSIIVPTFNRAALLGRALNSVINQSGLGPHIETELIVVDDGSTDGTAEFVRTCYPQVSLLVQGNAGVSAARNAGLSAATGEWLALLDSDDEWLPHKLARQIEEITKSGLKICHTEEIWIRNGVRVNQMTKHKKRGGWIFEQCLPLCAMSPSSIMIHRSVFDDVGKFDETLPACEDYDLWLRIAARYQVAYVEEPCINKYGGHDDQLSRQHWGMDRFRVIALERCLSDPKIDQVLSSVQRKAAHEMFIKKLTILLNGANKRHNQELADWCQSKLDKFSDSNSQ